MPSRSQIVIVLLTLGFLGIIGSVLVMGGSIAQAFNGLKDGQAVSCTVMVNAPFFGSNLVITQPPSCRSQDSCFISPLKSFSITSIQGDIGLWQSGVLYGTEAVDQARLSSAQPYTITACIPQEV